VVSFYWPGRGLEFMPGWFMAAGHPIHCTNKKIERIPEKRGASVRSHPSFRVSLVIRFASATYYNQRMDTEIARQLVELNRKFYADFGESFSATRQRIQPGVRKVISNLDGTERILDLGCGNGELARTLSQTGFHGTYLGLDFSLPLLADAESQLEGFSVEFRDADLTAENWEKVIRNEKKGESGELSLFSFPFSLITAFAVLHHIPGFDMRRDILQKVHGLLEPAGKFIHSNWQFLSSEKLRGRIQPWSAANLSAADVDEGDYLLDWRSGGAGLRYAHHFSEKELSQLAAETGFRVAESFYSDGANGKLGLYQIWEVV
jgi:tRNA (uracil-5-)-methyltransferase TRM9